MFGTREALSASSLPLVRVRREAGNPWGSWKDEEAAVPARADQVLTDIRVAGTSPGRVAEKSVTEVLTQPQR